MIRRALLRLYPRAWRRRYGDEIGDLAAGGPLSLGLMADLLYGALDAHLHPGLVEPAARQVRAESRINLGGRQEMTGPRAAAARFLVIWLPFVVVHIVIGMMLIDFVWGHGHYRGAPGGGVERYFLYEELYDLTLHLAMAATAYAGALLYASVARRVIPAEPLQQAVS